MPPIDPRDLPQGWQQPGVAPAPPPPDPYYSPKPQPFPSARPMSLPPRVQSSDHRQDVMLPSQVGNSETELELKKLKLREERTKAGLDPDTGKPIENSGMVGPAALQGLSEGEQDIVKGITQGRVPISSLAMARNPTLYKLVQKAFQYEPGTDLTTFARRQAAFQKFMSNPNSPMVRVNQALQHLDRFATNAHELNNAHEGFFTNPFNIRNYASTTYKAVGKESNYEAFANDRDALATELAAAFQGGGQSALADRDEWRKRLSAANSPEGFDKIIKEAVGLLGGRVEASNAQFKQAVGANADFYDLMSPEARKVYQKFAPDAPEVPGDKSISTTTKSVEIPEGYQHDHAGMLAHHTPGTLTVGQYIQMRQALDEKYAEQLGPNAKSHLDPKEVQDFVDSYNHGSKKIKIPALNVPLSEEGIVPGSSFLSEKDRAKAAASPLGTGVATTANAGTFGVIEGVMGQEGRDKLHLMEEENPKSALAGEVLGSLAPMKGLEVAGIKLLEKVAPNLTVTARRKLLGDILVNQVYGADRGFMGADDGKGIEEAIKGGESGTISALIGNAATKGLTPLLSNATSAALAKMKGVKMTTFQRLGLGKMEEGFSGVPFAHGARKKSLESFNLNFANQGLKLIGGKLPKNIESGTEVNAEINKQLNAAYNEIRPRIVGAADGTFDNAITAIQAGAKTKEKKAMYAEIKDAIDMFKNPETGHYDGQGYKAASERLRYLAKTWNNKEGDVAAGDMARAAEQARKQMQTLVQRQTPEVGQRLKNIERAWAHSVLVEDASTRALANQEGVASPAQVLTSIKKLDISARKGASARGKAFGQPYAMAAAKTLGASNVQSKLSIKETGIVLAAIGGIGTGAVATGTAGPVAVVLGSIAAGAYGPIAKRAVQVILSGKRPTFIDNQIVRRALEDGLRHQATGN